MALMCNRPDGRLIPVFSVDDGLYGAELVLALAKAAAARGETVLMIDQMGGDLMAASGIVYGVTLADVLSGKAKIGDAKYVTQNEHFTAVCAGDADLDLLLGSLAALSLSYDWVFIGARPGCTPAHIRLAGAADAALVLYDSHAARFMRAYWMLDAVRARVAKFDPLMIAQGKETDGFETYDLLAGTIKQFLGAAPALGGILDQPGTAAHIAPALLEALRQDSQAPKRAIG
ncbi:MAG: hypothetical protein JKY25_06735 [Robiginitomaculum sp.]|nr:hypothetical protein [Robiginitomaculum sp.]